MTIRNLRDMYIGWKLNSEVRVYNGTTLIYEGGYLWMPEEVLNFKVHRFDTKDNGLVIFMENEDE